MIVIVSDCRRISKAVSASMNGRVFSASGEEVIHVSVNDYGDAVRIFTLATAKSISVADIRRLINQKPWPQRVYEWWKERQAYRRSHGKCGHDAFLNGPSERTKCQPHPHTNGTE